MKIVFSGGCFFFNFVRWPTNRNIWSSHIMLALTSIGLCFQWQKLIRWLDCKKLYTTIWCRWKLSRIFLFQPMGKAWWPFMNYTTVLNTGHMKIMVLSCPNRTFSLLSGKRSLTRVKNVTILIYLVHYFCRSWSYVFRLSNK